MIRLLVDNPLLLLFVVAGIGYPLGQLRIFGVRLGIGAVLFVGLGVGSLHPDLKLPDIVYLFGLVLFVYTIGISSGPSFFDSLRGPGLRDNAAVAAIMIGSGLLVVALSRVFGLTPALAAGLFAGSLTNTPALAGAIDYLKHAQPQSAALAEPTVAYSLAYPFGVLGVIIAIAIGRRVFGVPSRGAGGPGPQSLDVTVVRVSNPDVIGRSIRDVLHRGEWRAALGRVKRGDEVLVAMNTMTLQEGDLVSVVASRADLPSVAASLGEIAPERIDLERSAVDYRRLFVSNREIAGRTLRDIDLPGQYGAIVTRVGRGDVEFLPTADTVVHLGDRLRVLASRGNITDVSAYLGDSFKALSEIDVLSFSLGILGGLALGLLPIPMPGGVEFHLGLAGGPLLVALMLGKLGRTRSLVWTLPYNANLTLRQLGLLLFLAGIGTRAGYSFFSYLATGRGLPVLLAGVVVTTASAFAMLVAGRFILNRPFATITGMLAGFQTQPAALAFALEQSDDEAPNVGYATVYPVATVLKVLIAQALVAFL